MQGMTSVHGSPHWSAADFLDDQQGVVSRAQLLGAGETPASIRRMIRRRDLAVVHPGIYVSHTGDPTWVQRTWVARAPSSRHPAYGSRGSTGWPSGRCG